MSDENATDTTEPVELVPSDAPEGYPWRMRITLRNGTLVEGDVDSVKVTRNMGGGLFKLEWRDAATPRITLDYVDIGAIESISVVDPNVPDPFDLRLEVAERWQPVPVIIRMGDAVLLQLHPDATPREIDEIRDQWKHALPGVPVAFTSYPVEGIIAADSVPADGIMPRLTDQPNTD